MSYSISIYIIILSLGCRSELGIIYCRIIIVSIIWSPMLSLTFYSLWLLLNSRKIIGWWAAARLRYKAFIVVMGLRYMFYLLLLCTAKDIPAERAARVPILRIASRFTLLDARLLKFNIFADFLSYYHRRRFPFKTFDISRREWLQSITRHWSKDAGWPHASR